MAELTPTERLSMAIQDVNRLLEQLLNLATVRETADYVRESDDQMRLLRNRITNLERYVSALKAKVDILES
jgi:hypothetical protein